MVRRVVGLINRLTAACDVAVTLRGMADVASRALVDTFPGSSVVIFEREPGGDTVRAVAGANIPPAWQMRAVNLRDVPLLDEAFRNPEQLVQRAAVHRGLAASDDVLPVGPLQAIGGAVPDPVEALYVVLFLASPDPSESELREIAIETTRRLLSASARLASGDAERARVLSAIYQAKVEWERTADGLPELVGLIDRRGRVMRVNRALERWSLGDVKEAIGRDLHLVLHRGCIDPGCALATSIAAATNGLEQSAAASFELADSLLDLDLVVDIKVAHDPLGATTAPGWKRAAFVVSNVTSLRRAERELTTLNRTLEQRVAARTAELSTTNRALRDEVARRRTAQESLRASERELEGLSERLMTAQEEERKRIAQDLHDSVGQSLSAIKYSLERAQVLARRQELEDAATVVESAVTRVQRVMDEVRSISMNLRPALLDDLGAASAVRCLCREWHDVYHEITMDTDIAVMDNDIPAMLGTNVFRAVQESLNNVARHAGAHRVLVSMRLEEGTLAVTVKDDGSGFAINGDVRRLVERPELRGLRGLRERAERSGGRCHVASAPGRGTTVRLEWPIAAGQAAREANARIN